MATTDEQWKAHIHEIDDPKELLREVVSFFGDEEDGFSCPVDPYYRDLADALVQRARELVQEETP